MNNNLQHKTIESTWHSLSLVEQLANVGSEVERAISWKSKNNEKFSLKAFFRAIELFDLTIANLALENTAQTREVCRAKELFADYFIGKNQYKSKAKDWQRYFRNFNFLARKSL